MPPRRFIQCPWSMDPYKRSLMEAELRHLLAIQAIEPVLLEHRDSGFYSIIFLAQKKSGSSRAIMDLKRLNIYIQ